MLLEWNEIESVADCAFNVWVGTPEREWVKSMWLLLEKQDLTSYEDDFEWHIAVFRLLVLGGIYRDFCAVAWDEHTDRWYSDWVDSIEIKPFILGQLYGRETTEDYDDELSNALSVLVELERSKVVVALSEGLGCDLELYLSLSMSRSQAADLDEEGAGDSESDHLEPTGRNSPPCSGCRRVAVHSSQNTQDQVPCWTLWLTHHHARLACMKNIFRSAT